MRTAAIARIVLGGTLILALGLCLAVLPIDLWIEQTLRALERLGPAAVAVFVLVYLLISVFCLPTTPFSLAAGFLFGLLVGTLSALAGLAAGAVAGCLLARYLFRDWFHRRLAGHPKFIAIERAVAQSGFKVIVLLRLCPLFPFGVMNYVLGLLPIGLGRFLAASLLGRLPATLAYVYLGSAARDLNDIVSGRVATGVAGQALFVFGLVTLLVVVAALVRIARRALDESLR